MTGTIRPVVYRDHHTLRWIIALSLHVVGSVLGALIVGSFLGLLGEWIVPEVGGRSVWTGIVLAPFSLLYSLAEVELIRLPHPELDRQVPSIWRRIFSPNQVALLYGIDLGMGLTTRVITGALYVIVIGALVWGNAIHATFSYLLFGLGRSLSILIVGWRLRVPTYTGEELQALIDGLWRQRALARVLTACSLAFAGGYWLMGIPFLVR